MRRRVVVRYYVMRARVKAKMRRVLPSRGQRRRHGQRAYVVVMLTIVSCYRVQERASFGGETSVVVRLCARHATRTTKKGTTCVAPCRWMSGQQQRQCAQSKPCGAVFKKQAKAKGCCVSLVESREGTQRGAKMEVQAHGELSCSWSKRGCPGLAG